MIRRRWRLTRMSLVVRSLAGPRVSSTKAAIGHASARRARSRQSSRFSRSAAVRFRRKSPPRADAGSGGAAGSATGPTRSAGSRHAASVSLVLADPTQRLIFASLIVHVVFVVSSLFPVAVLAEAPSARPDEGVRSVARSRAVPMRNWAVVSSPSGVRHYPGKRVDQKLPGWRKWSWSLDCDARVQCRFSLSRRPARR